MYKITLMLTLALGCNALDAQAERLGELAAPEEPDPWCDAFTLALESCDVDHYIDETRAPAVVVGCVGVAMHATGADPDGSTALGGALLGAYGYADPSGFENAVEACEAGL